MDLLCHSYIFAVKYIVTYTISIRRFNSRRVEVSMQILICNNIQFSFYSYLASTFCLQMPIYSNIPPPTCPPMKICFYSTMESILLLQFDSRQRVTIDNIICLCGYIKFILFTHPYRCSRLRLTTPVLAWVQKNVYVCFCG